MDYLLGAGLMFVAAMVLAAGRVVLNRPGMTVSSDTFGAAEAIAFVFTVLLAIGISLVARKAIGDWSFASLALMIAIFAVAGGASAAAWIWLVRFAANTREAANGANGANAAGPSVPNHGRRGRPTGAGGEGKRPRRAKRAA